MTQEKINQDQQKFIEKLLKEIETKDIKIKELQEFKEKYEAKLERLIRIMKIFGSEMILQNIK